MKLGTKIVIGAVSIIVLIIGLIVGGFAGFIYLATLTDKKRAEKEKQARIDGREFGRTTNQNGCIEKGFSLKSEHNFDKVTLEFVRECLESSEPIPNFCDGVRASDKGDWRNDKQCEKVPNNPPCHDTIYAKQSYCDSYRKRDQAEIDGRKYGREFGKTTDQNGCMEKGVALPNGFFKKWSFTSGCLRTSRPSPDFCKDVPGYDYKWGDEQCKKVGDNKDSCIQAFYSKQFFCR